MEIAVGAEDGNIEHQSQADDEKKTKKSDNETTMDIDDKDVVHLPQKRFYRQRAHSNPIADHCFNK